MSYIANLLILYKRFITPKTPHLPCTVLPITRTMETKALTGTSMIGGDLLMGVYIACHRPILEGAVIFFMVSNPIIADVKTVNLVLSFPKLQTIRALLSAVYCFELIESVLPIIFWFISPTQGQSCNQPRRYQ